MAGPELVAVDPENPGGGKARLTHEHVDAVRPAVGDRRFMQRVDPAEPPVADRRPVRPRPLRADSEPAGFADGLGDIGSEDEHFGGYAAAVEASAAETRHFDQGDPPAIELPVRQRVARAGAHDDEVIGIGTHDLFLPRSNLSEGSAPGPASGGPRA